MLTSNAEFAWPSGDQPGDLDFQNPVPSYISEAIGHSLTDSFAKAVGIGVEYKALTPTEGIIGRYRLSSNQGQWFVRVSSRSGHADLENQITDQLFHERVNVNPFIVAGGTLRWKQATYRVDVHSFIDGRHFNGSLEDLGALASTLANCHHALRQFSGIAEIRQKAKARCKRLSEVKGNLAISLDSGTMQLFREHDQWASVHRDWLGEMVKQFRPRLDKSADAQCIHGELHPGNAIFRNCDGAAVLIDFEESVHLFAAPVWDLAFMVQRFCLQDGPRPSTLRQRLKAVTNGYGAPLPELASVMRQIAWFTLATIIDLRISQGIVTPVEECDKFVRLERQAAKYLGVL